MLREKSYSDALDALKIADQGFQKSFELLMTVESMIDAKRDASILIKQWESLPRAQRKKGEKQAKAATSRFTDARSLEKSGQYSESSVVFQEASQIFSGIVTAAREELAKQEARRIAARKAAEKQKQQELAKQKQRLAQQKKAAEEAERAAKLAELNRNQQQVSCLQQCKSQVSECQIYAQQRANNCITRAKNKCLDNFETCAATGTVMFGLAVFSNSLTNSSAGSDAIAQCENVKNQCLQQSSYSCSDSSQGASLECQSQHLNCEQSCY
jgi:hypothetical protein